MRLQFDFYPNDELAIQLDPSGPSAFADSGARELFLFACLALRQLRNLGQHLVAQALAGLLVSETGVVSLFSGKAELPSGKVLLANLEFHTIAVVSLAQGEAESIRVSRALGDHLRYDESFMQALDREILTRLPMLVEYKGPGKKSFEATFPPFLLNARGFGLLGHQVNHHAFHSISGMIRLLGQNHVADENLSRNLVEVSRQCGTAYALNHIPLNQGALASAILRGIGV
jgi:hypothetical protein